MFKITGLYAAISALWLILLMFNVIRLRYKHKVGLLDQGNMELIKAIRIHGNATEQLPIALILLAIAEAATASAMFLHFCGVLMVTGRILHSIGLTKTHGISFGRTFGTMTNITVILILAGFNIYKFVS